jgi:hypothetical protein
VIAAHFTRNTKARGRKPTGITLLCEDLVNRAAAERHDEEVAVRSRPDVGHGAEPTAKQPSARETDGRSKGRP